MNENNKKPMIIARAVDATETKKCKCCGKVLPVSDFSKRGTGYRTVCKNCEHGEHRTDKFKDVTSRELIDELIARGYKGVLKKEIVKEFKL